MSFGKDAGVVSFTIAQGNIDNTYAFKTAGNKYLYAASNADKANYLREQESLDDNGSWKITIVDGVASIVAQGTNKINTIRYNSTSSSKCRCNI